MIDPNESGTSISLSVNGREVDVHVPVQETLLHTLRDRLDYTAPRGTCQIGVCGTCTVLVDGKATSSCITLTAQAQGREVTTPEGLGGVDEQLSDVQKAFVRKGAYQCSFCIPAMALSVHAALADNTVERTVEGIRGYLAGNLCRCGTYPQILEAVSEVLTQTPPTERKKQV